MGGSDASAMSTEDRGVVIKNADMAETMQKQAIDVAVTVSPIADP